MGRFGKTERPKAIPGRALAVHLFQTPEKKKTTRASEGFPVGRKPTTRKCRRLLLFAGESINNCTKALCVFPPPSILADKKFTRKPLRFSCLLPDPRELIEIKNKKKVHASIHSPREESRLTTFMWESSTELVCPRGCTWGDFSSPLYSFQDSSQGFSGTAKLLPLLEKHFLTPDLCCAGL